MDVLESEGKRTGSIVCVRKVTKGYTRGRQRIEVLQGLDLEVQRGEFLALMGPSGSGKTTLLNLIGGLDRPDEGEIQIAGERIDRLSRAQLTKWRARHVGFVFQFYNLLPTLSARGNVEIPLLLTHLPRARRLQNVAAALALVGLSDRARHMPSELSGGQQQRVAIARAIITDPTVLVCDEPTGDLDRTNADEILGLLQDLSRAQHKTIIMVTHDPRAADYASRRIYLDKGALASDQARSAA